MAIRVLSKETAEKIAAGEVIERPVSVVKELLDNAVDASASRIQIEILSGGKEYIKISDNGQGIAFSELPLAFLRHATSKITSIEDFQTLNSLGFRGEALPSIAAISKLKLISKPANQLTAGEIAFTGGEREYYQETAAREGTTVIVEELFFNTPARLKFLKSNTHEAGLIAELVGEYALGNPHISFELISQGKKLLYTSGNGSIREAVAEVWGKEIGKALIEEEVQQQGLVLKGLFSPFEIARSSRKNQVFFVNGRLVKNAILHTALETTYRGVLPHRKYPLALVYITLPPGEIDVNVHPAKTLIKFQDDRAVFSAVHNAVHAALFATNKIQVDIAHMSLTKEDSGQTVLAGDKVGPAERHFQQEILTNLKTENAPSPYKQFTAALPYLREEKPAGEGLIEHQELPPDKPAKLFPRLKFLGVYQNSYILAETEDSLCLIDQHAAHERILYEEILHKLSHQQQYSQLLLEPLVIDLPAALSAYAEELMLTLKNMGFDIAYFGDKSYIVRSVPNIFSKGDTADTLAELINDLAENKELRKEAAIAAQLACKAAIKLNKRLSLQEIEKLLLDLSCCSEPFRCPHGRPIIVELENTQISKWFKRIL